MIFLYIAVINPDNTFKVSIDGTVVNEGSLLEDFRYSRTIIIIYIIYIMYI